MVFYKTEEEIELIRQSCILVSSTLAEIARMMVPGTDTIQIDKRGEDFIRSHGGIPAFKGYRGFPNALCISVNEQVVHGIPSDYILKEGDIVSIDCGVLKNGYYGDSAYTFSIGTIPAEVEKLLTVTKKALYLGIEKAVEGNRVGDISSTIQQYAEDNGFSVVRDLVGHGVGRNLHESPEVPNFGKRGRGMLLRSGLVIAIEPMLNMGRKEVKQKEDGWTIRTADGKPSAHFEHTVVVRKKEAEILTTFEIIVQKLKKCYG